MAVIVPPASGVTLNVNLAEDDLTVFHLFRKVFAGDLKDIESPEGFTLKLHSPIIDGELTVDGEVYIE